MTHQAVLTAIEAVLDIARWAPSGDNAQPWKFRIKNDREVELFVQRTNPNIYEYRNGEPTLISVGALIENIEIAAPAFALKASWHYAGSADGIDHIIVHFSDIDAVFVPELFSEITRRSVDRRPFSTAALGKEQLDQLSKALNPDLEIQWYESLSDRLKIAALSALATRIRLTIPETFEVHRSIVDWKNRDSEHGIPSRALGVDPLTLLVTRWSMASWARTRFMNAMGAPSLAALQMDFLPGLCCASYFAIRRKQRSADKEATFVEAVRSGQAIQRFWLTASKINLVMQPCVAILAFWTYSSTVQEFSARKKARRWADNLAAGAEKVLGKNADIVFLGRIGLPRRRPSRRSTRLPLDQLLVR